ncbi:hypothetical protein RJ640_030865 [Escallonia rubra]|uniref:Transmembrane protein n=1 Tax=Escallonia rubra TaxID=112253 RepID=A0AA88QPT6_9ASTE|nr:hypothetical protein RJ640_030865 [Escallonia rubra]
MAQWLLPVSREYEVTKITLLSDSCNVPKNGVAEVNPNYSTYKLVEMSDWGPIFVAVVLFVLLSPGLLFQLPGRNGYVDFGNFHTSGAAIMVHALLYFALICFFLLALRVHLYLD